MLHQIYTIADLAAQTVIAQGEGGGGGGAPADGGSPFGNIWFMLIAVFAIMYFIVIRPNQKREQERTKMLDALSKGDKVLTAGGIFGTVVGADANKVVVRVSDEPLLKLEIIRSSIARVISMDDEKAV